MKLLAGSRSGSTRWRILSRLPLKSLQIIKIPLGETWADLAGGSDERQCVCRAALLDHRPHLVGRKSTPTVCW